MIKILPQSSETALGFELSGKIIPEDYDILLPEVDKAIAAHGKVNLLVIMSDLKGYDDFEAAKADFNFGTQEYRQVAKAAFVGDKKWQKWLIKLMDPFTRRTDERFFTSDQLEDAWSWVNEE